MEPIKVFFLVFLILMVMRAPMYLCLLGSSLLYIYLTPQLSMMTAMNKMMNAPNSFTLLAVPFFIFAGQVMNNGGVTDRIFGFAKKMIGHWSGGLAYVNVLSSLIFSGISGSALADVGGLGMIEIKAMRDEKYDDDLTLGVTGASSTVATSPCWATLWQRLPPRVARKRLETASTATTLCAKALSPTTGAEPGSAAQPAATTLRPSRTSC